jgi:hypothetical protein
METVENFRSENLSENFEKIEREKGEHEKAANSQEIRNSTRNFRKIQAKKPPKTLPCVHDTSSDSPALFFAQSKVSNFFSSSFVGVSFRHLIKPAAFPPHRFAFERNASESPRPRLESPPANLHREPSAGFPFSLSIFSLFFGVAFFFPNFCRRKM